MRGHGLSGDPETGLQSRSFRLVFCERFGCAPEDYERKVFFLCLYRHAGISARVIQRLAPALFAGDFELIRAIGRTLDLPEMQMEVNNFYYQHRAEGILRGVFRVRLSGQRLLNLGALVFKQPARAAKNTGRDDASNLPGFGATGAAADCPPTP